MMSRGGVGHREKVVVVPRSYCLVIRVVPVVVDLMMIQVGVMADNHLHHNQVELQVAQMLDEHRLTSLWVDSFPLDHHVA